VVNRFLVEVKSKLRPLGAGAADGAADGLRVSGASAQRHSTSSFSSFGGGSFNGSPFRASGGGNGQATSADNRTVGRGPGIDTLVKSTSETQKMPKVSNSCLFPPHCESCLLPLYTP
jgi:hypothetical protein